jgi:hypothetical protein
LGDPGKPVESARVRDAPFDDRVVLSTRDRRTVRLVATLRPAEGALDVFAAERPTGLGDLEEDVQ